MTLYGYLIFTLFCLRFRLIVLLFTDLQFVADAYLNKIMVLIKLFLFYFYGMKLKVFKSIEAVIISQRINPCDRITSVSQLNGSALLIKDCVYSLYSLQLVFFQ